MQYYYVYVENEVKGPFLLDAIQQNLNAKLWKPSLLCCQQGSTEWKPISDLFALEFVPKTVGPITKVLNETRLLALKALNASPFKNKVQSPPRPTTQAILQATQVISIPSPALPAVSRLPITGPMGAPSSLNRNVVLSQAPYTLPGQAWNNAQSSVVKIKNSTKPAPKVLDDEGSWLVQASIVGVILFVAVAIFWLVVTVAS